MKEVVFDMEVFPKWWCMVYSILPENEKFIITSRDFNCCEKVSDLRYGNCLIGFNIKKYDLRILNAIISGCDPEEVYETSCSIINETENRFNNYYFWNKFNFSDLYDDWKFGSLKEFESNIGMSIKESDVSFDKENLTDEDIEEIIKYCKHDVEATVKLLEYRREYIDSKKVLSEMFNIPIDKALKSTNAKLAAVILNANMKRREERTDFVIPERVEGYIKDNLPKEVIDLFKELSSESKEVELFDNIISFGIGGIHSTICENCVCMSDDEHDLFNIDVRSYYPSMLIKFNYMSRNVKDPKLYEDIFDLRVKLKSEAKLEECENGKTEKYYKLNAQQEALKLILNTTYGAMKNEYNDLFDKYNAGSLCYLGQLMLAALANKIYTKTGSKIIQSNTDGLLIKSRKDKTEEVKKLVSEWEFYTNMTMEYEPIQIFFQRDVNNYIEVKEGGKIKLKGKWSNQAESSRSLSNLNAPVTHKAILNYYINNKPIEETIKEETDIFNFCFTAKTGKNYDKTYYYINGEPRVANKVNRVVATTNEQLGTLKKFKKGDGIETKDRYDKIAELPEHCYLMNDELEFIDSLDRNWYIDFAKNKIQDLKVI